MSQMLKSLPGRIRPRHAFYLLLAPMLLQLSPTPMPARDAPVPARDATASGPSRGTSVAGKVIKPAAAAPKTVPVARAPTRKTPSLNVPVHTELAIERWLQPGEFVWNDDGVPRAPTTIVVNLKGRVISVYRAGYEIGRSSIIYGADDKPTPAGAFPILEKDADHVSSIYGTPMPYMLRLTWDGISIHASKIANDLGTNGCVGLPEEFAKVLFKGVEVGDRVLIWNG